MRAVVCMLALAAVALGRAYYVPLVAEDLALLVEEVLDGVGSFTRISLRGEQAQPFYAGAREFWPDVEVPYVLGLWLRADRTAAVLAAPSGTRLAEWRLYSASPAGRPVATTADVREANAELLRVRLG